MNTSTMTSPANDTTACTPSLSIGETREQGNVRFHRYRDGLRITDLTHAGKRGKAVEELYIGAGYGAVSDSASCRLYDLCDLLAAVTSYCTAAALVECFIDDCGYESTLTLDKREHKSISVKPAGFEEIVIRNQWMSLFARYDDFSVNDLTDMANGPRIIPTCHSGAKTAIKRFYAMVKARRAELQTMTFSQVWDAMNAAGVRTHHYCAVD